jgi:hypothetical protein
MKKILSLIILLVTIVLVNGCRKNGDNPKLPPLIEAPFPLLTIDESTDFLIADPALFKSTFTVGLYFKDNTPPKSSDVVVTMNGNYKVVKVLKAGVTSLPATVSITANDLASLFGITIADIKEGDYFEIGINMTLNNGLVAPAFVDGVSNPYGPNMLSLPGARPIIKYRKVCPLDLNNFVGDFIVDDPDFWEANYPVTIALDGTSGLKIIGWLEAPSAVIHLTVDQKKHTITIPTQTYLASYVGLHNLTVSGSGEIDACATTITLNTNNSASEGDLGSATMTIHKAP